MASRGFPITAVITIQGIMIPPVPSTGRISNTAITKAMSTEFFTPISVRPTASSTKVMDMISA